MTQKVITPVDIAEMFLERYKEFQTGIVTKPVFDTPTSNAMINSIRNSPMDMITFYIQASFLIHNKLEEEHGEGSIEITNGLSQFHSVMFGWFVPMLSSVINANDTLVERFAPELITSSNRLPIPEGDPSDIFKNIEGFSFDEWITDDS